MVEMFRAEEDAARAYDAQARVHRPEDALNFPDDQDAYDADDDDDDNGGVAEGEEEAVAAAAGEEGGGRRYRRYEGGQARVLLGRRRHRALGCVEINQCVGCTVISRR